MFQQVKLFQEFFNTFNLINFIELNSTLYKTKCEYIKCSHLVFLVRKF